MNEKFIVYAGNECRAAQKRSEIYHSGDRIKTAVKDRIFDAGDPVIANKKN